MIENMRFEGLSGATDTPNPGLSEVLDMSGSLDGEKRLEIRLKHKNGSFLYVLGGHEGAHVVEVKSQAENLIAVLDIYPDGEFLPIPFENDPYSFRYRMTRDQVEVAVKDFVETGKPSSRLSWELYERPVE